MNRVSLVAFPLLIMFLTALISGSKLDRPATIGFQSQNITVNSETGGLNVEPINLPSLLSIAIIISVALGLCLVLGIKVLGSGISGSVIPIVFMVTILTGVFTLLSGLSYPVFVEIPVIGFPLYFGLIICYVIGVASLAVASGGD